MPTPHAAAETRPAAKTRPATAAAPAAAPAAVVVGSRPELVRHILSFLASDDIARAELTCRTWRDEGRAARLPRACDVPLLDRAAKRTRRGYIREDTIRVAHFEVVPMHKAAAYPCRAALLRRLRRLQTLQTLPPSRCMFGWSCFFDSLFTARRGLLRACPRSPALKELQHFRDGFEADLGAAAPQWEHAGALTAEQRPAVDAAFLARARTLSYGCLFLVCFLAKAL